MTCARTAAVLVLLVSLSGCGFYQYRVWPNYLLLEADQPKAAPPQAGSGKPTTPPPPGTVGSAGHRDEWQVAYTRLQLTLRMGKDLEAQYETYGRTHERTVPVLATILTPIIATISGLAITGTTGGPVTALALTGGASSAYASALSSTVRERIYAQGKVAARCLINTYEPFLISDREYGQFRTTLDSRAIPMARGALDRAINEFKAAAPGQEPETVKAAEDFARLLTEIHAKGLQADTLFRGASAILVKQFTQVSSEINRALERTELDTAALKSSLIASFGADITVTGATAASKAIGSLQASFEQKAERARVRAQAESALEKLQKALAEAAETAAPIQHVLIRIGDNPVQDARECVDKAIAAVQVEPLRLSGDVRPTLSPGDRATVNITGGVRPYTVTAVGDAGRHLESTLDESQPQIAILTIRALPEAAPGTYALEVTDKTASTTRAIPVAVRPPQAVEVKSDSTTIKQGGTLTLHVRGGKSPYTVQTVDQASPFGEAKADAEEGGTKLSMKVKDNATPAEYSVQVKSADNTTSKSFKVTVEPK